MKLSDAMVLGSSLIKFDPYRWISKDGSCGCAVGMAAAAVGWREFPTVFDLFSTFPLLGRETVPPSIPGQRNRPLEVARRMAIPSGTVRPVWMIISLLAMMVGEGKLRFEDLVAWVRQVEAEDEAGATRAESVLPLVECIR